MSNPTADARLWAFTIRGGHFVGRATLTGDMIRLDLFDGGRLAGQDAADETGEVRFVDPLDCRVFSRPQPFWLAFRQHEAAISKPADGQRATETRTATA